MSPCHNASALMRNRCSRQEKGVPGLETGRLDASLSLGHGQRLSFERLRSDFGERCLDIVVHAIANGPEVNARVLAYEVGRKWGHRVNLISAGPWASRAASAIDRIAELIGHWRANAPLREAVTAAEIAAAAAFLCSPLASGITGTTVHVDKGFHAMGVAAEQASAQPCDR
jgi:enoyl-[acyl-carrier-protein] reductase (NADH)